MLIWQILSATPAASHFHGVKQQPQKQPGIPDIPSQRTELATILYDSMEEAHAEQELAPCVRLVTVCKVGIVQTRELPDEVALETFGGLKSHLDSILEHSNWERRGWHGRQPQPEVSVHL